MVLMRRRFFTCFFFLVVTLVLIGIHVIVFSESVEVVEVVRKVTHVDENVVAPVNLIKSSTLHAPKTMPKSAWSLRTNFPKYTLPMLV